MHRLGSKQVLIQPWIKFMIDIVNEKLRFRLKDIRKTLITSRIQALIVVRLQIDGKTSFFFKFFFSIFLFFFKI